MTAARSVVATGLSKARKQKAVIERRSLLGDPSAPVKDSDEWWVLLPNGRVEVVVTASAALRAVQKAANRGNKGVTITTIEWRDVPADFVPPKGAL